MYTCKHQQGEQHKEDGWFITQRKCFWKQWNLCLQSQYIIAKMDVWNWTLTHAMNFAKDSSKKSTPQLHKYQSPHSENFSKNEYQVKAMVMTKSKQRPESTSDYKLKNGPANCKANHTSVSNRWKTS